MAKKRRLRPRRRCGLCLILRRLEPDAHHPICRECRHHVIRSSLTYQEAADILGISRQACHAYAQKHRLRPATLAKKPSTAKNAERHVKTRLDKIR